MAKITLNNLTSLTNEQSALSVINNNSALIVAAMEKTLSRDGTSPNSMSANLDMNSFQILNLPYPATETSALRLKDLNDFIGGGTIHSFPAGGTSGQVLTKNSSTDYDVSWAAIPGAGYNPKNYGAIGDGVTNDYAAIAACIAAAKLAGGTIILDDGTYAHGSTIEWGWNRLKVFARGANVVFKHTGAGVAHSFNGIGNYPASQGCIGGVFGGGNRISLSGNALTTNLVYINNWHFGYMCISGRNCSNAIVFAEDTGIVGASGVENTLDIQVSSNIDGTAFTTVPLYGLRMTSMVTSYFPKLIIESVGNVASSTTGVSWVGCVGNVVGAGTVESCLAGGVALSATCSRNAFIGLHSETNGTQQDWIIQGNTNYFVSCTGAGTASGQFLAGNNNIYDSCRFQSAVVQAGATENIFRSCSYITAFTDSGTRTKQEAPNNIATANDPLLETLSNKTIGNTNIVTLKDTLFTLQDNGDTTKQVVFELSGLTTATTRTITVPDASLTLVGLATTQTIQNKTLDNTNTVTLKDTLFTLQDDGDTTKQAKFQLSGLTTATTRTYTLPDTSDTLVTLTATQELTNKTLNAAVGKGTWTASGTWTLPAFTAGGLITLSSGQIAFPATQVPSADANTLDDYEEGTFTPTLTFGGGSTGMTFSTQSGTYTKIGNTVFVRIQMVLTAKGSSTGQAIIGGLPFTISATGGAATPFRFNNGAAGVTTMVVATFVSSTATANLERYAAGAVTVLADTDFNNNSTIILGGFFFV